MRSFHSSDTLSGKALYVHFTEKEKKRVSANRAFKLILNDSLESVAKKGAFFPEYPIRQGLYYCLAVKLFVTDKETMFYRRFL